MRKAGKEVTGGQAQNSGIEKMDFRDDRTRVTLGCWAGALPARHLHEQGDGNRQLVVWYGTR